MDLMTMLAAIPGAGPTLPYVAAAVAICACATVVLPRPAAGATGIYSAVYAVVNFVALNFGQARNATAPAAVPAMPTVPVLPAAVPLPMARLNSGGAAPAAVPAVADPTTPAAPVSAVSPR